MRKRVLIVDDHQPFRATARELLEDAGYIVAGEAADAAERAAVAADAPDAVLLDVQLPDEDGFAVATALTADGGQAVVLISSREADDYGRRIEACGARGFIPKSKLSAAAFAALSTDGDNRRDGGPAARSLIRDPVLVLPVVVAGGLVDRTARRRRRTSRAPESRPISRWRGRWPQHSSSSPNGRAGVSVGWALAAAAFAILGADLEWSSSRALWTLGFVLEGLWVAFLARLVLAFPERRPWSRSARFAVVGAFVATLGAQLVGALFATDARDLLSVAPRRERRTRDRPSAGVLRRGRGHRRARPRSADDCASCAVWHAGRKGRSSSRPPSSVLVGLAWLGRVIAIDGSAPTFETIARATVLSIPAARDCGDPLVAPAPPAGGRPRRRAPNADAGDDARATRPSSGRPDARGRVSDRRRPLRRCVGKAGRASREPATVPSRR